MKSMKNSCEKDLHFNTCFSYCRGELCNAEISVVSVGTQKDKPLTDKADKKLMSNDEKSQSRNGPVNRADVMSPRWRPGIGRHRRVMNSSAATGSHFLWYNTVFFFAGVIIVHHH